MQFAVTTHFFYNHFPEAGYCRLKHVGGVSYVYQLLSFYCCAVVGINILKFFHCVFQNSNVGLLVSSLFQWLISAEG
jgi:hypothetical protein